MDIAVLSQLDLALVFARADSPRPAPVLSFFPPAPTAPSRSGPCNPDPVGIAIYLVPTAPGTPPPRHVPFPPPAPISLCFPARLFPPCGWGHLFATVLRAVFVFALA